MAITFTNRARQLLIVELNNGESIYLNPGSTSDPIAEHEINGNQSISKLISYNLMSANPVKTEESQPQAGSTPPPADQSGSSDATTGAPSGGAAPATSPK